MKREVKTEKLEIVHSTGNVFRDLGVENADGEQLKAILAAEIIRKLGRDGLSVRKAQSLTGVAAADFSRIRTADLGRFTIDRLMMIVNRLGSRIDVAVKFRHASVRRGATAAAETERTRLRCKPHDVRILLVGESPPAGDTFFFDGNSRLYAATKAAFERFLGQRFSSKRAFLSWFKGHGFYLEDLCAHPVNGMTPQQRRAERRGSIASLSEKLRRHKPAALIVVMKAIARPVKKAVEYAGLGRLPHAVLSFPAYQHSRAYETGLLAELRKLKRKGLVR